MQKATVAKGAVAFLAVKKLVKLAVAASAAAAVVKVLRRGSA